MSLQFGVLLAASLSLFSSPPAASAHDACVTINVQEPPANVDMDRVRATWLDWYNGHRTDAGLAPYASDATLDRTASNWSFYAVKRGTIDHRRAWKGAYYDYGAIRQWFADVGVTFANVRGTTFTENIGWGIYACDDADCTDELLAAVRTTYDFFLSEKGKQYRPHYNAIVHPHFTKMGLGIGVDSARNRYYVTAHFGTEFAAEPAPVCGAET